jgi:hypothetical protein
MNRETGGKVDREAGPEGRATGSAAAAERSDQAPAEKTRAEHPEQPAARGEPDLADTEPDLASRERALAHREKVLAGREKILAGREQALALRSSPGQGQEEQAHRGRMAAFRPRALPFQGLAADPRMPTWIIRALAALAVGATLLIWQSWRLGLTAATIVVIADIIYRSRTTAVIPAATRATSAQRRSRRRLALLRGAGYVTLNGRAIPGTDQVIDHLVIGPAGVFALDSERWDRRLPVRTSSGVRLYHGPFSQNDRLDHAQWEAAQATRLISAAYGSDVSVQPAMAIFGPTIPWTVASLGGVDVFTGRRLRKYFRRKSKENQARLSHAQIGEIHAAAAKALPPTR